MEHRRARGNSEAAGQFPIGKEGGDVRKISLLIGGAAIALAACSGDRKTAASDDLKKELELASTSDGLGVGTGAASQPTQVVSAIERTTPGPKAPSLSSRARRYHRAPTHSAAPVTTEAPATVTASEPTAVAPEPVATQPAQTMPRPTPQTASYPGGNSGTVSSGRNTGSILGAIIGAVVVGAVMSGHGGSVMRGGVVIGGGDGDTCDPRTDGRRQNGGYINQRIPRIGNIPVGTFPVSR